MQQKIVTLRHRNQGRNWHATGGIEADLKEEVENLNKDGWVVMNMIATRFDKAYFNDEVLFPNEIILLCSKDE